MKKLARLTALLLTGALLLVLASCGAAPLTPEQQAKKQILAVLNEYRITSIHLDQLKEVEQLSAAEQELIEHFRAAGKTVLPKSEADEAIESWRGKTEDWSYCSEFGPDWDYDENAYILSTKVPANTPEGKAELWAALKGSGKFIDEDCKHIGIAVVTIDGQMYWSCYMYN